MAEKMDKEPAAPTQPVSVEKKQQQPRAAPTFLDINDVNLWTFLNALIVNISFGVGVTYYYTAKLIVAHYPSLAAAWLLPRAAKKLTDAENTLGSSLVIGMLWGSTPQAAAGALALLLPCRRWRLRRAAGYAALALTVASHCMYAGAVLVFALADPARLWIFTMGAVIFMFAVIDLLGFLALLRGEWAS